MTAEELAAASVFGTAAINGSALHLSSAAAAAWRPDMRDGVAWASIRTAVRRFVRQVMVTSARAEVAIVIAGHTIETVSRSYNHGAQP